MSPTTLLLSTLWITRKSETERDTFILYSVFNAPPPPPQTSGSPLIGQLTHAWPSSTYKNRAAVLSQFLRTKLPAKRKLCINVGLCDIVWCQKVMELKAGLLMRRFRSSIFCGREELPFELLCFQDILHANEQIYKCLRKGRNEKSTTGLF